VVVEGDRAEEFGEGDSEALADSADGIIGKIAVAIMYGVEDGKERRVLSLPLRDDFLIGHCPEFRIGRCGKPSRKEPQ
jgi:hypothetical protein